MVENTASAKATEKTGTAIRSKGSRKGAETAAPSLNMDELRELAELVNEHGFTDFEFENQNIRVRLSKMAAAPIVQAVQPLPAAIAPGGASAAPAAANPSEAVAESVAEDEIYKITSPIVGTFYRSPAPDKEPYVKEGTKVSPESVVCIVEAMKLMNEIQAEVSGEIVKIFVENGQPVEYGQPLFGVKQ